MMNNRYDESTGIADRQYITERMKRHLARHKRYGFYSPKSTIPNSFLKRLAARIKPNYLPGFFIGLVCFLLIVALLAVVTQAFYIVIYSGRGWAILYGTFGWIVPGGGVILCPIGAVLVCLYYAHAESHNLIGKRKSMLLIRPLIK
jgi:hypothetical protein